ncbi:MAG: phosphotransferase [Proteobacteria bacterium]|nr:phosphotransferase [Pseudomonadota bacterium]
MIDLQKEFSGAGPVRPGYELDTDALQRYMEKNVEGYSGLLEIGQFKGGQSNPTYLLAAGGKHYVLRRKPSGVLLKSAHAVDREYRVITALAQTDVPVAKTFALCTDETVIGTWFYIMDYVEGRIFWTYENIPPNERGEVFDAMVDTIARLHQADYERIGLGDFGRQGNYFARQISIWSKQYQASITESYPGMDKLIQWMNDRIPDNEETSIVHGDFRLDNLIFHPTEPRILAILDWELSTLGHPLSDFSYQCMAWRLQPGALRGMAGLDYHALELPTEKEYVDAYCRRTDRDSIKNAEYYVAFNIFRVAAISFGILGRVRDGTASSQQAKTMADLAEPLAELGWSLVKDL